MRMTERSQRSRGTFLGILGVAVAAALVLPTSAVGQTTTAVTAVTGSAYALDSNGEFAPTPDPVSAIEAPPCPQTGGSPGVNAGGISTGVLATGAQCDGVDTPRGRFIRMTADVANVTVGQPTGTSVIPLLEAGEVHVECTADLAGVDGFTSISSLSIAGVPLNAGTFTSETDLSGVVSEVIDGARLIINEVVPESPDNPDRIAINGIHLTVPARPPSPPLPPTQSIDLIIGHVECARTVGQVTTTTTGGATTTTNGDTTTTTAGGGTTTTAGGGTTTTAGGGATTTAGGGATTTAGGGPGTTRPPTGTLARTGAMVPPWLLVAGVALLLGALMRFGSTGGDRLASTVAAAPSVGAFRPVRPEPTGAAEPARSPLDAAAADALAEMERSSSTRGSAPPAPVEMKPTAKWVIGELIERRRRR